jgi:hypothetical protein
MNMSIPIEDIFRALSPSLQICKDLKSLINDSRKDIEKHGPSYHWATYINPIHSFKISWPTQRWGIVEIGDILTSVYRPIELRYRTANSVNIPLMGELVPNVSVTIDKNGGVEMQQYVKSMKEKLYTTYQLCGATKLEDRLGEKAESNEALVAFHVTFPNVLLWEIRKIKRFEDRMYIVAGLIIEGLPCLDLVLDDLQKMMNTVAILGSRKN